MISDVFGNPISPQDGLILPYADEMPFNPADVYACAASASNAFLSQAATTENPRDFQPGFMPVVVRTPIMFNGYRAIIRNVVAAGVVTSLVTRLALYTTHPTTGLPDNPVLNTDTGGVTIATARANAGNWAETASSGNALVQWNLASGPVYLPVAKYWRLLAIESVYTTSSETAFSGVGPGGVDYLIGGSTSSSIRRAFGFAKVEGATSSLSAWTLPTAQGGNSANFPDLNGRGEALTGVTLLLQRVA